MDPRKRAPLALDRKFRTVVAHLNKVSSLQKPEVKKDDVAKAKGWTKTLTTCKFVLHVALYMDTLTELSCLSLLFQRDNISTLDVVDGIKTTQDVLSDMIECDGSNLRAVRQECINGSYRDVTLQQVKEADAGFARSKELIQPLLECLMARFESFTSDKVLHAVDKLDPKNWSDELKRHADEEVKLLLHHFERVLSPNGCDIKEASAEWTRLKITVRGYYHGVPWSLLRQRIFTEREDDFRNILHLFGVIQANPLATAKSG